MTFHLPRWLLIVLALGVSGGAGACIYFWKEVSEFASLYEPQLKILSLVLGPLATIASIYWGYKSKQDLVDLSAEHARLAEKNRNEIVQQSSELGSLRVRAELAQKEAAQKHLEIETAVLALGAKSDEVKALHADLRRITEGSQELWKVRNEVRAFEDYQAWLRHPAGAKIITVANLKGGVGKTTLASNFAAYVSEHFGASVLLLDLDYQGSLSNMLMLAAGKELVDSSIDQLLAPSEEDALVRLSRARVQLDPRLPRCWLVPSSYTLAQVENQLLLNWLLRNSDGIDVRYRLARVLLDPNVRREFKLIILDTPPRMTIGTVNALVASHYYVVPTALDRLSSESVPQFITNMKAIKADLGLDIELAGIAGMMSRVAVLSDNEQLALDRAREGGYVWNATKDFVLEQTIPRRSAIADAAGGDIAYFGQDSDRKPLTELFDPLFSQLCENINLR